MTSRLAQMQARFQQKQLQEREDKLVRLYENQQQRAFERVGRGSAGSTQSSGSTGGGGKVRQMFDERRQKAGVDKSYPLEPLKNRGGSVDRLRTVIKSQNTTVSSKRNGVNKPTVTKREVVRSIYNNNNGDESYEEHRFRDDDDNDIGVFGNNHQRDLIEMMNNHNLGTSSILDDEEMPRIGFDDELDDSPRATTFISATGGKLANLGGKLPSQAAKVAKSAAEKKVTRSVAPESNLGKTFRKDTKPIVKRTVRPAVLPPERTTPSTSVHSQPPKAVSSPVSSPTRSVSQTMQSGRTPSTKAAPSAQSARTPSAARPSSKQPPRSTVARDDLSECKYCHRRFATDRLPTHEQICGKTSKKNRKIYDATKHRVEGTELEQYVRKGAKSTGRSTAKSAPKKDWRKTHQEFIAAIRAAKHAQEYVAKGGKLSDLPPPPPSSNPDYVQCPHCGRKFNESAAERHIPKCASYQFNKGKTGAPAKGSGKNVSGKGFR